LIYQCIFFLWDVGVVRYTHKWNPRTCSHLPVAFPYVPHPHMRLGVQDHTISQSASVTENKQGMKKKKARKSAKKKLLILHIFYEGGDILINRSN